MCPRPSVPTLHFSQTKYGHQYNEGPMPCRPQYHTQLRPAMIYHISLHRSRLARY